MPAGTYTVFGDEGRPVGTEEFRTAPGIAGSRWFSTIRFSDPAAGEEIVDLSVDEDWRPMRLRIGTGEHHLILQRSAQGFHGARDAQRLQIGPVADFYYRSPGFNAATANRLMTENLTTADLEVTWVEAGSLALHTSQQRYERLGEGELRTRVGRFAAVRWRYTDLNSGWTGELWTGGAIVLSYPGVVELAEYDPVGAGPFPL